MPHLPLLAALLLLQLICACLAAQGSTPNAVLLSGLELPENFSISVYTANTPSAREIAVSANSTGGQAIVYVGSRAAGTVYAIVDKNGNGTTDYTYPFITGLEGPHGVAWRNNSLYLGYFGRIRQKGGLVNRTFIARLDGVDEFALQQKPYTAAPVVLNTILPHDAGHGAKYIRFGPDGLLYLQHGVPCNVCRPPARNGYLYGSLLRMKADGTLETVLTGLRNSVGYDWQPSTGELYLTDNGRDGLGDNRPDDRFLYAPKTKLFFGFPYCHQQGLGDPDQRLPGPGTAFADPEFNAQGKALNCSEPGAYTQPVQALGPHVAALGMKFYRAPAQPTAVSFPEEYDGRVLIAQHGSWNRSVLIGFRVMQLELSGPGVTGSYSPFVTGWSPANTSWSLNPADNSWGRPVDLEQLPDGSLLLSDDQAGVLYRITYNGSSSGGNGTAAPPQGGPGNGTEGSGARGVRAPAWGTLLAGCTLGALLLLLV